MTPSGSPPSRGAPATLPHVFVDRSLGAIQLPALLRAAGIELTTMREHYGEQIGQGVDDPDWVALTAERGWIGFHKDAAIRHNEAEKRAVIEHRARLFCVPRADITAAQLADRYLRNYRAIARASKSPGPYIYGVYAHGIERLPLED